MSVNLQKRKAWYQDRGCSITAWRVFDEHHYRPNELYTAVGSTSSGLDEIQIKIFIFIEFFIRVKSGSQESVLRFIYNWSITVASVN